MSIMKSRIARLEQNIATARICDTLIVIHGGDPSNVVTPEQIAAARERVDAINMRGKGSGKIHICGGPPLLEPTRFFTPPGSRGGSTEDQSSGPRDGPSSE